MQARILTLLTLGAAMACGGSYSNPEPDPDYDVTIRTEDDNGNGDGDAVIRANNVTIDRVVETTRDVLQEEGWTVFRVNRSGSDRVIEARRGGDELLRIYATPHEGDVALRGWRQENGEPKGFPSEILQAIELRLKTGN
jgi:hypothetical protein